MRRTMIAVLALACLAALALPAGAAAEEAKLKIGGTTYTKWLWGTQRYDGSLYNFTTVPGEGYGDNGQGSEVELLLSARLSKEVNVSARIHSRFSQNQWTNFGGFGGSLDPNNDGNPGPCVGGDCGEFDSRSNQYVKLRGVTVTLTPGYNWIDSATIGASDWGMFDPFVIGRIRYIDRDNGAGLLFQGSGFDRKWTWDVARISLPRLWAGPNYSTGDYPVQDAAYGFQTQFTAQRRLRRRPDLRVGQRHRGRRHRPESGRRPRSCATASRTPCSAPSSACTCSTRSSTSEAPGTSSDSESVPGGGRARVLLRHLRLLAGAGGRAFGRHLEAQRRPQRSVRDRPLVQRRGLRHRRRVRVDDGGAARVRRAADRGQRRRLRLPGTGQRPLRRVRRQRVANRLRRLAGQRPAGGDDQRRQRVHRLRRTDGRERDRLEGHHAGGTVLDRHSRALRASSR